ncbi:MAG: hypothetical protein ABFD14_07510 [Anaerolineaceae bacterium]
MNDELMPKLTLSIECQIFTRNAGEEWRHVDDAPGIFEFDGKAEVGIRIQNIGDDKLRNLLQEINHYPQVKMLNLSENRKITDQGLEILRELPGLTMLNLSSCDITDKGTPFLLALKKLEWLNLSYCNRITMLGLKPLVGLTRLQFLDLQGCVKVKTSDVRRLKFKKITIHK